MTETEILDLYGQFASGQSSFLLQQMLRKLKGQGSKSLIVLALETAVERELDKRIRLIRPF